MPKNFEGITSQEEPNEVIAITSGVWRRGERPRGHEETSAVIKQAHALGLRMHDYFDQNFLSRRNFLILKAETTGLTQAEADEMVAISKTINQKLTGAIEAAPPTNKNNENRNFFRQPRQCPKHGKGAGFD